MKQPVGCLTQNDDYFIYSVKWYCNSNFCYLVRFVCFMDNAKMSKVATITAWVMLFICGVVFAYGHGYKSGRNAQLDFEDVLKIAKSQFTCKMEKK